MSYGFAHECKIKYSELMYSNFLVLFSALPIACTVTVGIGNWKYFCCHGGISKQYPTIEQINQENRFLMELPEGQILHDLLWSDPIDRLIKNRNIAWNTPQPNDFPFNEERKTSFFFTKNACLRFLTKIGCQSMIRAHEAFPEGYHCCHFGIKPDPPFPMCFSFFGKYNYLESNPPCPASCLGLFHTTVYPMQFLTEKYSQQFHDNNFYAIDRSIERIGYEIQNIFNALKRRLQIDLQKQKVLQQLTQQVNQNKQFTFNDPRITHVSKKITTPRKCSPTLDIRRVNKRTDSSEIEQINVVRKQSSNEIKTIKKKTFKSTQMTIDDIHEMEEKWTQSALNSGLKVFFDNSENKSNSLHNSLNDSLTELDSSSKTNNSFNLEFNNSLKSISSSSRHNHLNATIGTQHPVKYEKDYVSRLYMEDSLPVTLKKMLEEMKDDEFDSDHEREIEAKEKKLFNQLKQQITDEIEVKIEEEIQVKSKDEK